MVVGGPVWHAGNTADAVLPGLFVVRHSALCVTVILQQLGAGVWPSAAIGQATMQLWRAVLLVHALLHTRALQEGV